jgi:prolyl 4-hydroxylase
MLKTEYKVYIIIFAIIAIVIIFKQFFYHSNFFKNGNYAPMTDAYEDPYIVDNIITEQEATHIINKSSMYFNDSRILGDTLDTTIRKSKSTWLYKDDPIIMKIMVKISGIVKLPIENAEALQVVKYEPSGYYNEHHDSCCDGHHLCNEFIKRGGQRIKTVLIYLNDEFTEGATNFPVLNKKFKPPKYSAVVFNPLATNSNKCHPKAIHAGLPVKSGVKYVANLWFREHVFT